MYSQELATFVYVPTQVRRVRLDVRLRLLAETPLSQLRALGVLLLLGDVLASEHASLHVQGGHVRHPLLYGCGLADYKSPTRY